MIPKTIHYCWLSNDPIPQNLQNYMRSWKEKLPDYKFILWNFSRFDINQSLWVKQAFENKKYAFAADYIRLYAVYNYGGFYMDMDIEVLKPFDDLLENKLVLAYENDNGGIEAGCFGAEKNNQIIKNCLEYYTNRSFIKHDGSFDTLPLPRIMAKYCDIRGIDIKDKFFFTCKSFETGVITQKKYSYTIHNFAGSWLTQGQKKRTAFRHKIIMKYGDNIFSKSISAGCILFSRIKEYGFIATVKHYKERLSNK